MDVKSLGQGGQNAFEVNYSTNIDSQHITQNNNSSNDINLENRTSGTDSNDGKNNLKQRQITEKDIKTAADKLNKLFEGTNTHVEYERIGTFKTMSIQIVDNDTKEVIKELPPKKIIEMIDKLCELAGIMVDEKA